MTTEVEFAPGFDHTEEGWVIFPEDASFRKDIFPPEVMGHPAKANIYMIESILNYVSKPGDIVMDPMSGTGTILVALTMNRGVIAIEIEELYLQLQKQALELMMPGLDNPYVLLLHGDCRKFLPLNANHIVFSPPYAAILKSNPLKAASTRSLAGSTYEDSIQHYSTSADNVGNLSRFLYNQAMEDVYQKCYQSLPSGGTLTVILKDYIEEQKRVFLSDWLQRVCIRAGFDQVDWFKRQSLGTGFLQLWRSRGMETVSDEDIVVFRRP